MGKQKSVIKLTKSELEFAADSHYPLLKLKLFEGVQGQFHDLGKALQSGDILFNAIPLGLDYKISKGENLKGLPYMVLDYPRISGPVFPSLIRIVFWWGKYISFQFYIKSESVLAMDTADCLSEIKKLRLYDGNDIWDQDLASASFLKTNQTESKTLCAVIKRNKYVRLTSKCRIPDLYRIDRRITQFGERINAGVCLKNVY